MAINNKRQWSSLNEKYVREGFILFHPDALDSWEVQMKNGRGRPFTYCDKLIQFAVRIRSVFRLGYRQVEGMLTAMIPLLPLPNIADYTTLWRRAMQQGEYLQTNKHDADIIILDSTGMSKQARGFHLGQKWRKRRDYIKLHVAVDEDGNVLIAKVTSEKGGSDAKIGEQMLSILHPKQVLADGAYDSKRFFRMCEKEIIDPGIPVRRNARPKPLADPLRARTIKAQRSDLEKWKEKVGFNRRWTVERTFGAFKRRHGDATRAKKYHQQSINNMMSTFILLQRV